LLQSISNQNIVYQATFILLSALPELQRAFIGPIKALFLVLYLMNDQAGAEKQEDERTINDFLLSSI
jgi:hypothetical protein